MSPKGASTFASYILDVLRLEMNSSYLQKKLDDHRSYTALIFIGLIPLGLADYLIEWGVSDQKSKIHFGYYAFYFWLAIPAYALWKTNNYLVSVFIILLTLAICSLQSTFILGMDEISFLTIISSIVTTPFFVLFILLGLSLYLQIASLALILLIPFYLGSGGIVGDVPDDAYIQLSLQSCLATVFVMGIFSWSYYHRHILENALEKSTRTDPLTGAANRRFFDKFIKLEVLNSVSFKRSCSLIMLDIDHFKRINDTYGHPTGDRVIRQLSDLCVHSSRKNDLVARLGGEEFAIVMPETNSCEAEKLAERIRRCVEEATILSDDGQPVKWTVSLGVTELVSASVSREIQLSAFVEKFIQSADSALYQAKNGGRNQIIVSSLVLS
ncbi:TPA: diguanylate cyclase [Klebsiella pneumoniae]